MNEQKKQKEKTAIDILNDVVSELCDNYCKYPEKYPDDEELYSICRKCPLSKIRL